MDKEELRQKAKDLRLTMSSVEVSQKSGVITARLSESIDWSSIKSLHCYTPMARLNEVNTWPLLKFVWQHHPSIVTAVSSARRRGKYEAVRISQTTKWRGLLPDSRVAMPKDYSYNLIIVPTLAFDNRGYRLGWGVVFMIDFYLTNLPPTKLAFVLKVDA